MSKAQGWTDHLKLREGALHARLGIAPGKPIPDSVLKEGMRQAKRAHDITEEHEIEFAEAAKGFHHGS